LGMIVPTVASAPVAAAASWNGGDALFLYNDSNYGGGNSVLFDQSKYADCQYYPYLLWSVPAPFYMTDSSIGAYEPSSPHCNVLGVHGRGYQQVNGQMTSGYWYWQCVTGSPAARWGIPWFGSMPDGRSYNDNVDNVAVAFTSGCPLYGY
jgi:hypothetical protein